MVGNTGRSTLGQRFRDRGFKGGEIDELRILRPRDHAA